MNASFSMTPPEDGKWGGIETVGGKRAWNGMMRLLYDDTTDAAIGTIFYIKTRIGVSEPHVPFVNVRSTYVVPK